MGHINIIKNIQKETGLSQYRMAQILGVSQQLVNRYATQGTDGMAVSRVMEWCEKLNVEPCKIIKNGNNSN